MFAFINKESRTTVKIIGEDWEFAPSLGTTWASNIGSGYTPEGSVLLKGSNFIVAGGAGNVATSPDGFTWTSQPQLRSTFWSTRIPRGGIHNGANGRSIIVGSDGGLAYSTNGGVSWTYAAGLSNVRPTTAVVAITYRGDSVAGYVYMAVTDTWEIFTSPDLTTWTFQVDLRSVFGFTGVARSVCVYSGGGSTAPFVVVGDNGQIATASSSGGFATGSWANRTSTLATAGWGGRDIYIITIENIGNTMIIGGEDGQIAKSPATPLAGIQWSMGSNLSATAWGSNTVYDIAQMSQKFIAVGANGRAATSENLLGTNWAYQSRLSATAWGAANAFKVATGAVEADFHLAAIVVGQGTNAAVSPPHTPTHPHSLG